ncbi:hypothetical protein SHO565_19210 [Streptomyces sp. HO565]
MATAARAAATPLAYLPQCLKGLGGTPRAVRVGSGTASSWGRCGRLSGALLNMLNPQFNLGPSQPNGKRSGGSWQWGTKWGTVKIG